MNDHCVEGQGLDVSELLKGFQGKGRREREGLILEGLLFLCFSAAADVGRL